MKRFHRYTLILIISLICTCLNFGAVEAQQEAVVVHLNPANAQVAAGQTVDLAIEVVGVQAMYGFEVELGFDPQVLEVVDADADLNGIQVALGEFLDPGFVIFNQADNVTGSLRFALTQLNPSQPKSGTGNLIVVTFRGKQAGAASAVMLKNVEIAKTDGSKIPIAPQPGEIQVVQTIAGPTNTSIPIQNPGTPMPTVSGDEYIPSTATRRLPSSVSTAIIVPTAAALVQSIPTASPLLQLSPTATLAPTQPPAPTSVPTTQPAAAPTETASAAIVDSTTVVTEVQSQQQTATRAPATPTALAIAPIGTQITSKPAKEAAKQSWPAWIAFSVYGAAMVAGFGAIILVVIVLLLITKRGRRELKP